MTTEQTRFKAEAIAEKVAQLKELGDSVERLNEKIKILCENPRDKDFDIAILITDHSKPKKLGFKVNGVDVDDESDMEFLRRMWSPYPQQKKKEERDKFPTVVTPAELIEIMALMIKQREARGAKILAEIKSLMHENV